MGVLTGADGSAARMRTGTNMGPGGWAVALWAALAVAMLAMDFAHLQRFFPDTDDATRLIQIRSFFQTGSWFDATLHQFGPNGLPSHWSRLIDGPIAMLISLFALVVPMETAELAAQAVWPLLLLLPLLVILARTLEVLDGRTAAAFGLALAATALTALLQFKPGRIDHHNAMIVATVGSIFLMAAAPRDGRTGYVAGTLAALSLAIGFEALPVVALSTVALVLWALLDARKAASVTQYCLAFGVALALTFAATIAPSDWTAVACDALSINLVALAAVSTAGAVFILTRGGSWLLPVRLGLLAVMGLAGLAIYGALEPACLSGPFAQVPKAIYPIWLDSVGEARPLWWHFARMPALAVSIAAMLAAGAVAYALLLKRGGDDRMTYLAVVAIGTSLLALWQFKFLSYATWLAIPAIAIVVARVEGTANMSRLSAQLVTLLCLSPATVSIAAALVAKTLVAPTPAAAFTAQQSSMACGAKAATAALAALPPGLIVSHIDLGPVIAATTHHRVLSAPYHRLPDGIAAAHAILAAPPSASLDKLASIGAGYVVDCPARAMPGVSVQAGSETLLAALRQNRIPSYLTDVTPPAASPLRVWRVDAPRR